MVVAQRMREPQVPQGARMAHMGYGRQHYKQMDYLPKMMHRVLQELSMGNNKMMATDFAIVLGYPQDQTYVVATPGIKDRVRRWFAVERDGAFEYQQHGPPPPEVIDARPFSEQDYIDCSQFIQTDDDEPAVAAKGWPNRADAQHPQRNQKRSARKLHSDSSLKRTRRQQLYGQDSEGYSTEEYDAETDLSKYTGSDLRGLTMLDVANQDKVTEYYDTRLKQLQQLACKAIAKAWIKVIEPKKQSKYPYNKGSDQKPPWWPEDDVCEHKEPDHLSKKHRVALLISMLRCDRVPIARLKESTKELDTEALPYNRKELLLEIYRVAEREARIRKDIEDGLTTREESIRNGTEMPVFASPKCNSKRKTRKLKQETSTMSTEEQSGDSQVSIKSEDAEHATRSPQESFASAGSAEADYHARQPAYFGNPSRITYPHQHRNSVPSTSTRSVYAMASGDVQPSFSQPTATNVDNGSRLLAHQPQYHFAAVHHPPPYYRRPSLQTPLQSILPDFDKVPTAHGHGHGQAEFTPTSFNSGQPVQLPPPQRSPNQHVYPQPHHISSMHAQIQGFALPNHGHSNHQIPMGVELYDDMDRAGYDMDGQQDVKTH